MRLMELAGGDRFDDVRRESEEHQREHRCGLHNAGGPQMQLVAALARAAGVHRALDLGSGLGYSTLWIASAVAQGGSVIGIDDDPSHTVRASEIAAGCESGVRVEYVTGAVSEVLSSLEGRFDMIHDDAWFAKAPDHLERMLALLRPGGLLTMANWFLLVDAITGEPRNDWESFAGPDWAKDTFEYAHLLASRPDLHVTWVTRPPIAFGTTQRRRVDVVRAELEDDPTVDITTTGRTSGLHRRIEIWMLDIDGRFFITGTPGRRDWLANLNAEPNLIVHLKRHGHVDLAARATTVHDETTRRAVLEHLSATWYRNQEPIDTLVDSSPMVEVVFDDGAA